MLEGESHVSRIQTRLLCNSICYVLRFSERLLKSKKKRKDKKKNNSSHRELGPPVISPLMACLCEGRGRKVKVEWKNLQSKQYHQYNRTILRNFFIWFHRHFKTKIGARRNVSTNLEGFRYEMNCSIHSDKDKTVL